jgi:Actin-like ATPase involved in cell morphogenesis
MIVKGKEITEGVLVEREIIEREVSESLAELLFEITEVILEAFESVFFELTSDIYENGILLTGGGSLLSNMDIVIENVTGFKVQYAEDRLSNVALGLGKVMKNLK